MLFFFQAEDGIRDYKVTGVQTCALPIYPEVQRLAFEPFFTTRSTEGGTGLGLSLAQEIVQRYRGTIALSSADRKSTRLNSSHLVISYAVFCLKKKKYAVVPHHF